MKNLPRIFAFVFALMFAYDAIASAPKSDDGMKREKQDNLFISAEDLDKMKESQLLTYLHSNNYQSSEYAVYYFEQKGKEGIPALLRYLQRNEKDKKIASAVLYALGRVGKNASKAAPVVGKFMEHEDMDVRRTAIAALGKMGRASDPAVPKIAEYLNDRNEWTRTLALRSLKEIDTPQARAAVTRYENKLKLEEARDEVTPEATTPAAAD